MTRPRRARWRSLTCLAVTIALGLLSRRYPLPGFLAEYTGDALYTVAVFWVAAFVRPAAPGWALAITAAAFSAAIECSQLVTVGWLDDLRRTRLGALLLGQGFQWQDLLAYTAGAAVAWGIDGLFVALSPRRRLAR